MKVILSNNTELDAIVIYSESVYSQNQNRKSLRFVFPGETDINQIDELFTPENCDSINLYNPLDGSSYIHTGYVIRESLKKTPVEITPATDTEPAVYEDRVEVTMAQISYEESQIKALKDIVDVLCM